MASGAGKRRLIVDLLCAHYARRLRTHLKRCGHPEANTWTHAYAERYHAYMDAADFGPGEGRFTSYLNIYSGLAAYEVLREHGLSPAEGIAAYDHMCRPMRAFAAWLYRTVDVLPGAYGIVVKSLADDLEGPKAICWETEVLERSEARFEYKIHSCLYHDVCAAHGYPEFTAVFCNHDHWAYGSLRRHVRFERLGAIGDGDPCCHDIFHRV